MSQANRGMGLENLIEYTNTVYRQKRWAVVNKRPTPVKILRTHRNGRVEGHLEKASTVDYEGVYRARALQFESKSTKEVNRFPLNNFHEHQVKHLNDCLEQGAIAFSIIEFVRHDIRFFVPAKMIVQAWDKAKEGGPKSISFEELNYTCHVIPSTRGVPVDYLSIIDKLLQPKKLPQEVIE
ncbi:Holliday junction resolvase RecU [Effusibacillus consociatus]|uniref:Holliday junction resolvase RecU n=1 Tax=Effusibacillus consociatus TaxID=1117041 RepID=A0ABV9Q636_9BACL